MADNDIRGVVGANRTGIADGTPGNARLGKTGELIFAAAHGRWYEAVSRGQVFSAQTAATGVAPGTSVTTTLAFALYNPYGSGKNLVILKSSMGYVSGTLGAGVVHYTANVVPTAAATSGTAITPVCGLFAANTSIAKPYTTATVPANATLLRPFCSLGASLATTAVQPWQIVDENDGEFIVAPGCTIGLHATAAAGTSPLVVFGMQWEEVPIVS